MKVVDNYMREVAAPLRIEEWKKARDDRERVFLEEQRRLDMQYLNDMESCNRWIKYWSDIRDGREVLEEV